MVDNISFDESYLLLLCIGVTKSLKTPKWKSRISKDRQHNVQNKKDKQWSIKLNTGN